MQKSQLPEACPELVEGCENDDATKWLAAQNALLLPVQYFMVTSTLPRELRPIARSNQKLIYGLLLRKTAESIQKLARDPEWVGGEIGLLGILQTWRRDLGYHVHAHFIVPGGGISTDPAKQCWLPAQRDYLMPERAVAKILRGKFRDALKKHPAVFKQVSQKVWRRDWVVNIKSVGTGRKALEYLARYIFRMAISNKRILCFEDGKVTFTYKDAKGKWHEKTLEAEKFISRFLQHVLPKGFVKVRYYGFLSPNKRHLLEAIKERFNLVSQQQSTDSGNSTAAEVRVIRCPKCGSEMVCVEVLKAVRSRATAWPERWRAPPWLAV